MRVLLGLLFLALLLLFGSTFLLSGGEPTPPPSVDVIRETPATEATESAGTGPSGLAPGRREERTTHAESVSGPVRPAPPVEREVLGRLLSDPEGSPLWGYTVHLAPSGTRPTGIAPAEATWKTDADGGFHATELDRRGPWDVYAWPFDPGETQLRRSLHRRVGVAIADPVGARGAQEFRLLAGPIVFLRSPLPSGVAPEDVLLEAQGRASTFSSDTGGYGGIARARLAPDGSCFAQIPHVTNVVQEEGFGVRAVTRDGLWSVAEIGKGRLRNETRAEILGPLERRGKIAFRLEVESGDGEVDEREALRGVEWHLPFGDASRDALDLPIAIATSGRSHRPIAQGDGTYEVHDLPLGPVELRARESGPAEGGRRFDVVTPIQAMAVHGDPQIHVVRLVAVD